VSKNGDIYYKGTLILEGPITIKGKFTVNNGSIDTYTILTDGSFTSFGNAAIYGS